MAKTLLLLSIFAVISTSIYAKPEGYYKQEYQFKKSSATYKNNQLETKNDDEGYYGKQGDLTGTVAPQVEQHNQHSEFISPAVDGLGHSLTTYNDRDLTPEAERVFRDHNIQIGSNRQYSHSSSSSNFQGHGSQHIPSYSTPSNLGKITQNVQYDMEQQLREAIRSMHRASSYSTQMRTEDMQYLENQLRANITRNLQDALKNQYGQQTTRGQSSYSVTSSGYNPVANYDTNELTDLKQRLETDLMKNLQENARRTYSESSSSSSSSSSTYGTRGRGYHRDSAEIEDLNRHGSRAPVTPVTSSNYRPYRPSPSYPEDNLQRPERISYGQQPVQAIAHSTYGQSRNTYGTSYDRDFPTLSQSQITINPTKRITDVMQTVQNDITQQVRNAIRTYETRYSASAYTLTNSRPEYQIALDDLKRELRYNLTRKIQDELEHTYGRQDTRGEYSFSANSHNNANYRTADLDDLKRQVENNLINYLETSFRSYETNYQQSRTQYSNSQRDYTRHGPQYTQSLTSDTAQNPSYVRYEPGPYPGRLAYSRQSSYSASSSFGSGATGDTQQLTQLQDDLNRNLQEQMNRQSSSSSAYGSSSYGTSSQGTMVSHPTYDDHIGQQTIEEDLESLIQRTDDFGNDSFANTPIESQSQSKPLRGDIDQAPEHENSGFGKLEFGRVNKSLEEVGQETEDIGQKIEDLDGLSQQPEEEGFTGYGKLEVGNQNAGYQRNRSQRIGTIEQGNHPNYKPQQEIVQETEDIGQQIEDLGGLSQQPEEEDFTGYGKLEVGNQKAIEQEPQQEISQETEDLGQKIEDVGQIEDLGRKPIPSYPKQAHSTIDDDYEDDIILSVKPLTSTTTTTTAKSTTPYETYGVYRNRYRSNIYSRPQHTTEKMSLSHLEQQIDNFAAQLAETQQIQDGFNNDFIDHGDYLQHKPQENDFHLSSTLDNDDATLSQQVQEPEDFRKIFQNPEDDGYAPALSLSNVHNSYINQQQYANAPQFNTNSHSRTIPASSSSQRQEDTRGSYHHPQNSDLGQQPISEDLNDYQQPMPYKPSYQSRGYIQHTQHAALEDLGQEPISEDFQVPISEDFQEPISEDFQHPIEPESRPYVPSYQQQGRSYSSLASPDQASQDIPPQVNQETDTKNVEQEELGSENAEEKCNSSEGVDEEEAVTEVVKPLGFWQKVGGKISSGYNSVKQKAKSLVGST